MPTGYTADVCDGKLTDFNTFVLRCARAMGACIMMRDDPMDKLPRRQMPDEGNYYRDSLAKHRAELARLQAMPTQDAVEAAAAENYDIKKRNREQAEETRLVLDRLQSMRARVADWKPPTSEHVGLKEFMLQQIDETIRFDGQAYRQDETLMTGSEWLSAKLTKAHKDIAYAVAEAAKEKERNEGRVRWINQLYDSLEQP